MAWGDPTSLKFDVEKISEMRRKLQETSDDLINLKTTLLQEIATLKQKWNTPAGRKFASEVKTDWGTQVGKYVNIINAVDQLLATAESNYRAVENKVNSINS